jgi:hypothetical protein
MTDIQPYENTLSIEELRREVRECWDRELAIANALRDLPEMPPPWVLLFFDRAAKWPEDSNLGKKIQRELGLDAIPPKSECETGAGVWYRIRQGLLAERPEEPIVSKRRSIPRSP